MQKWTWTKVDTDKLNQPRRKKIRGVDFHVFFGFDDMPDWVRGGYDDKINRFVIEFSYRNEPRRLITIKYDEHVWLRIDKFSRRLHALEIDVDAMRVDTVRLLAKAEEILQGIPANAETVGADRVDNYEATSGAFSQVKEKLASVL